MRRSSFPIAPCAPFLDRPSGFFWHYLSQRLLHFAGLLGLVVAAAGCATAVQYGMKLLVDAMASPERQAAALWWSFAIFLTLIVAESVLWRLAGFLCSETVIATGVDVRLDLFEYLAGHSVDYFSTHLAGALGNRITGTAGNFGALINAITWNIAPPCIDFFGALILFATIDWRMTGALLVFVVLVVTALGLIGLRCRPLHGEYARAASSVGGELIDTITNIWSVKSFAAVARERVRLAESFLREGSAQRRSWRCIERTRVLHDVSLWVLAGSMLAWAIALWQRGEITSGDVVVVSALTFRILHGSRDFALALIGTTQNFGFIAETLREIGRHHDIIDARDAQSVINLGGAIAFENVSFCYSNGRRLFSGFDLTIAPGQKIGIVGPSGAGKSTLISLIQRLHDVQEGFVLIDGQPLSALRQESLRAMIAVVPQDICLFHRTVMENIRYGRPGASEEDVVDAARAAYCDSFIRALPEGYDTLVGERGIRLSGGQRQRIGIARAFLKDAPILILDEATAALDTASEVEIQLALANLKRGRTVLAIAHRLSTLASCERILVLLDGKCVEDGSPAELRRRGGTFADIWRLQAEGLALDEEVDQTTPA